MARNGTAAVADAQQTQEKAHLSVAQVRQRFAGDDRGQMLSVYALRYALACWWVLEWSCIEEGEETLSDEELHRRQINRQNHLRLPEHWFHPKEGKARETWEWRAFRLFLRDVMIAVHGGLEDCAEPLFVGVSLADMFMGWMESIEPETFRMKGRQEIHMGGHVRYFAEVSPENVDSLRDRVEAGDTEGMDDRELLLASIEFPDEHDLPVPEFWGEYLVLALFLQFAFIKKPLVDALSVDLSKLDETAMNRLFGYLLHSVNECLPHDAGYTADRDAKRAAAKLRQWIEHNAGSENVQERVDVLYWAYTQMDRVGLRKYPQVPRSAMPVWRVLVLLEEQLKRWCTKEGADHRLYVPPKKADRAKFREEFKASVLASSFLEDDQDRAEKVEALAVELLDNMQFKRPKTSSPDELQAWVNDRRRVFGFVTEKSGIFRPKRKPHERRPRRPRMAVDMAGPSKNLGDILVDAPPKIDYSRSSVRRY